MKCDSNNDTFLLLRILAEAGLWENTCMNKSSCEFLKWVFSRHLWKGKQRYSYIHMRHECFPPSIIAAETSWWWVKKNNREKCYKIEAKSQPFFWCSVVVLAFYIFYDGNNGHDNNYTWNYDPRFPMCVPFSKLVHFVKWAWTKYWQYLNLAHAVFGGSDAILVL